MPCDGDDVSKEEFERVLSASPILDSTMKWIEGMSMLAGPTGIDPCPGSTIENLRAERERLHAEVSRLRRSLRLISDMAGKPSELLTAGAVGCRLIVKEAKRALREDHYGTDEPEGGEQ